MGMQRAVLASAAALSLLGGCTDASDVAGDDGSTSDDGSDASDGTTAGDMDLPPDDRCGDGKQDAEEECDDGNTRGCDGCSGTCRLESAPLPAWSLPLPAGGSAQVEASAQNSIYVALGAEVLWRTPGGGASWEVVDLGGTEIEIKAFDAAADGSLVVNAVIDGVDTWVEMNEGGTVAATLTGVPVPSGYEGGDDQVAKLPEGFAVNGSSRVAAFDWTGTEQASINVTAGGIDATLDRILAFRSDGTGRYSFDGSTLDELPSMDHLATNEQFGLRTEVVDVSVYFNVVDLEDGTSRSVLAAEAFVSGLEVGPFGSRADAYSDGDPVGWFSVCNGTPGAGGCESGEVQGFFGANLPGECVTPTTLRITADDGVHVVHEWAGERLLSRFPG